MATPLSGPATPPANQSIDPGTSPGRPWVEGRPLRLIIAGGGTGGHVLPAVAVLEEFARRQIAIDCLWIGTSDGIERQAAAQAGVAFRAIRTGKLRRYLDPQNLRDAARIPIGVFQAARIVRGFRPDVILSTGGFASVPTVIGARRAGPIVTHEQTAILGLATRINLRFGCALAVSYPETAALAAGKTRRVEVTGNPIRSSLRRGDADRGRSAYGLTAHLPILTVMGGARGASPVNDRVRDMLPGLLDHTQVVHQAGPPAANDDAADLAQLRSTWSPEFQRRYVIKTFIGEEIADVYAMTDLVLARAGAGTVAELAGLGLPSVLIPLPHAGGDEQTRNAAILARAGAAVAIPQDVATPVRLHEMLTELLRDTARRRRMSEAARSLGNLAAAARLTDLLLDLASAP